MEFGGLVRLYQLDGMVEVVLEDRINRMYRIGVNGRTELIK